MRKNTRKIFVFFLALCITCASISFPVYAGNGANKSVDSSAYIVVNGKNFSTLLTIIMVPLRIPSMVFLTMRILTP